MTTRVFRLSLYLVAFAATGALAASGDEFYDRLFNRGISQFNEGNYAAAYSSLRLAAFGMLEDVKRFETAEIYTAVAAMRLHHEADARAAAQRVAAAERIERRYASLPLPDAVRKEFDDAARTLLTADQLAMLRGASPAPVRQQPQPPAVTVPAPQPKPAQPQSQPQSQPARPPSQAAASVSDGPSFADAERAVNSGDLARARALYRAMLDAPQLSHAAALRAAEGLYRARDFAGAIRAFDRAGPIGKGEEQYHWYLAVALYENGRARDAKRELRAALPYIEATPEVQHYRALIEAAQ